MDLSVHVCDVRKPLLSVAAMNDQGLDVHFFADKSKGAVAVDAVNKTGVAIHRRNNVFEIDATVLPWPGGHRQVPRP